MYLKALAHMYCSQCLVDSSRQVVGPNHLEDPPWGKPKKINVKYSMIIG